jgi:hypothetical protein
MAKEKDDSQKRSEVKGYVNGKVFFEIGATGKKLKKGQVSGA